MGHASPVVTAAPVVPREMVREAPPVRFLSLMVTEQESGAGRKSATFLISIVAHTLLVAAIVIVPILYYDTIPDTSVLKAFFVAPLELAPPPPPPPPPAAGPKVAAKTVPRTEPVPTTAFVAPIEMPEEIKPEEGLDLGVEGGVPGGVEGGVPGGVVGGVVGGLPAEPPPAPQVVRVGGMVAAPKLLKRVEPIYPDLAIASRASATIILEAQVDVHGAVKTVRVLRGHPLFDDSAMTAVKQWRYKPLLLNGQPTEFILTVTVLFNIHSSS
jgi:periplasmic protein TonB